MPLFPNSQQKFSERYSISATKHHILGHNSIDLHLGKIIKNCDEYRELYNSMATKWRWKEGSTYLRWNLFALEAMQFSETHFSSLVHNTNLRIAIVRYPHSQIQHSIVISKMVSAGILPYSRSPKIILILGFPKQGAPINGFLSFLFCPTFEGTAIFHVHYI